MRLLEKEIWHVFLWGSLNKFKTISADLTWLDSIDHYNDLKRMFKF